MVHAYKDPYAPPLGPKVPLESPPWFPSWKQYKGRTEWWANLGYKDPDLKRGLSRGIYSIIEERDLRYVDKKVPDGTSFVGPYGNDSHYHRNHNFKYDTLGKFKDYEKKVVTTSLQYKQIAKKCEISDEHPGIQVNPLLNHSKHNVGQRLYHGLTKRSNMPCFWNKPMNEGCLEKGLAMVKYAVPISLFATFWSPRLRPNQHLLMHNLTNVFKEWRRTGLMLLAPFHAFVFGFTSCASATFRNEDDIWNWIAASAVVGLAHATIKNNIPHGIALFAAGSILGTYYQLIRVSHNGFGMPINQISHGYAPFTGPLEWKRIPNYDCDTLTMGSHEILATERRSGLY